MPVAWGNPRRLYGTSRRLFIHSSERAIHKLSEGLHAEEKMKKSSSKACLYSKANGSLMRITPLGIWGHHLEVSEIANYARQDTALSHPNPSCGFAVACYSIAVATLIKNSGKRELAFNNAQAWLDSQESLAKERVFTICFFGRSY